MERKWTQPQLEAIEQRDKNILVAAAAGSGKTAVLVERIIRRITDEERPGEIDRLLVVTFTNAAAAEMLDRIGQAVAGALDQSPDNAHLKRQLALLEKASVTTIHSFCLDVVRTHASECGLDPSFRIASATEAELFKADAIEEVVDELYEDDEFSPLLADLVDAYTNPKLEQSLYDLVGRVFTFTESLPDPEGWLREKTEVLRPAEIDFAQTQICRSLLTHAKRTLADCVEMLRHGAQIAAQDEGLEKYPPYLLDMAVQLEAAEQAADFWQMYDRIDEINWGRLPTVKRGTSPAYKSYVKNLRDSARKEVEDLKKRVFHLPKETYGQLCGTVYPFMRALAELVLRLYARYAEKKREKNVLDFSDLEHFALQVLRGGDGQPTEAARELSERFDEILIDEYQDTSRIQESIFSCIKKEDNLFLVGDIKQSIYRFRNTDPSLFLEKKDAYRTGGQKDRKIILGNNFRSDSGILEAINRIFGRIMSRAVGEVDYDDEERLYPGLCYENPEGAIPRGAELCLIEPPEEETEEPEDAIPLSQTQREALLAAKKIQQLIASGYLVLGGEGYRPIRYRDIAVLLRTTKEAAPVYGQVFAQCGIPCYTDVETGFFVTAEIQTMLSLLKVLDNPLQDIPLLAVLRSHLFLLTSEELADIRLSDRRLPFWGALRARSMQKDSLAEKCAAIAEDIRQWRVMAGYMKLDELLWRIYTDTGYYDFCGARRGGELRQANLRALVDRARGYEKTSFRGLYSFIRFIDRYREGGGELGAAKLVGEEHDVVRIMSIHKSKGLEFPVVIIGGVAKKFNLQDLYRNILLDAELGFGPKCVELDRRISYDTPMYAVAYEKQLLEAVSEEMRILYVAMTRAREKLLLIGTLKNPERSVLKWSAGGGEGPLPAAVTGKARSYLDWLGMALLTHPAFTGLRQFLDFELPELEGNEPWSLSLVHAQMLEGDAVPEPEEAAEQIADEQWEQQLRDCVYYQYPYERLHKLPGKVTVTELKNLLLEEADSERLYPRPLFLNGTKLSASQVGTAYHTVMQRIDFACGDLSAELSRIAEEGHLSQEELAAVDPQKIARFLESPAGIAVQGAENCWREVMFGIPLPAEELYGGADLSGETLLLQGVIDCVYEIGGKLFLLDYKTEWYDDAAAVRKKYHPQLVYYARAAEMLYNRPVSGMYLYMFHDGRMLTIIGKDVQGYGIGTKG